VSTTRITSLDLSKKAEGKIRAFHEQVTRLLGKVDYSYIEYLTAVEEAAETNSAIEASVAATENELTPAQEAQLETDVLHQFALQHLREQGVFPESATYEQYVDAIGVAKQTLAERGGV
jgi:hypothetical protein